MWFKSKAHFANARHLRDCSQICARVIPSDPNVGSPDRGRREKGTLTNALAELAADQCVRIARAGSIRQIDALWIDLLGFGRGVRLEGRKGGTRVPRSINGAEPPEKTTTLSTNVAKYIALGARDPTHREATWSAIVVEGIQGTVHCASRREA